MKIYCCRHGESEANARKIFSNRGDQYPLTESGVRQSEGLLGALRGVAFDSFFSSPLLRARQTANILSKGLGIKYEVTESLREFDVGVLEGRSDEAGWEMERALWVSWFQKGDYDARIEGGESMNDIRRRFLPLMQAITHEYLLRSADANVLLVGHGAVFTTMLPPLTSNLNYQFVFDHWIGNGELIILDHAGDCFVCRQWGEALPPEN